LFILIGLSLGLLLGLLLPVSIPPEYSLFMAVGLLAALDSVFGGINARLRNRFRASIFLTGVLGNALIAAGLTGLGQRLGLDLYLAAVVFFGSRIFQNFAEMRRLLLTGSQKKGIISKVILPENGPEEPE
jgi:small basic protein